MTARRIRIRARYVYVVLALGLAVWLATWLAAPGGPRLDGAYLTLNLNIGHRQYVEVHGGRFDPGDTVYIGTGTASARTEYRVVYGPSGAQVQWRVEPTGGLRGTLNRLALWFIAKFGKPPRGPSVASQPTDNWNTVIELAPSGRVPGDWDLVSLEGVKMPQAIPYLHRVTDRRAVQYLDLAAQEVPTFNPPGSAKPWPAPASLPTYLELSAAMTRDHPDDPYAAMFRIDALAAACDGPALQAELDRWRARMQPPSALSLAFRHAQNTADALRLSAAGENLWDLVNGALSPSTSMAQWLEAAPAALKYEGYAAPVRVLPLQKSTAPNFLGAQTMAKVLRVVATEELLAGRRSEALDLLSGEYRFSQEFGHHGTMIEGLIGIAMRAITTKGLEIDVLNACETPQEMRVVWARLEMLNSHERAYSNNEVAWLEPLQDENLIGNMRTEVATRYRVSATMFQLVRAAAAARFQWTTSGKPPAGAGDLAPWLTALPGDPFSTGTLRMNSSPNAVTVYSVGPDGRDDRGALAYDPTNGTISSGDLFTVIPKAREYPFAAGGVRAATAAALLAQFPKGLPADPFADTRGRPLAVSPTRPVYVYSFGPDADERVPGNRPNGFPDVPYDPVNGFTSRGDISIQVPAR